MLAMDGELLQIALAAGGVAMLLTHILVPLTVRAALLLNALDRPGGRRLHNGPIPRLGGVAIILGLAGGAATGLILGWETIELGMLSRPFLALGLGSLMVFLTGLGDDLVGISALKKLLVEVVAATLVVLAGWRFEVLDLGGYELELAGSGKVLAILWIVGVTNAVNLIDGLDGLATGVVAIIGSSFLVFVLYYEHALALAFVAALVGSCLGFLRHNAEPARIFMGDAGSLTLGFLLGSLSVFTTLKSPTAVAILIPILALGVPVIDTVLVTVSRFLERPKGRFFDRFLRILRADRNHLHHLLESALTSKRSVVRLIYLMVAVSCMLAAAVALTKRSGLGLVLIIVELAAVFAIRRFGLARRARRDVERKKAPGPSAAPSTLSSSSSRRRELLETDGTDRWS